MVAAMSATRLSLRSRVRGCLLGGAVGDALGAPVTSANLDEIRSRHGKAGIAGMVDGLWPAGSVTANTQLALFTVEGILRADVRGSLKGICHPPSVVGHAYSRWLTTQGEPIESTVAGRGWDGWKPDGWLVAEEDMHRQRAPDDTTATVLRGERLGSIQEPVNDSRTYGAVVRTAAAGLIGTTWGDGSAAFERGAEFAALTHGNPTGYIAAGHLAQTIAMILRGSGIRDAAGAASEQLRTQPGHESLSMTIARADQLAHAGEAGVIEDQRLGDGWDAAEALAIPLYATLSTHNFSTAALTAVNHDGNSAATGAITGNLAGALYGVEAIPDEWIRSLDVGHVVARLADDLCRCIEGSPHWDAEQESSAYPGW